MQGQITETPYHEGCGRRPTECGCGVLPFSAITHTSQSSQPPATLSDSESDGASGSTGFSHVSWSLKEPSLSLTLD